jgi:hypothetical protein
MRWGNQRILVIDGLVCASGRVGGHFSTSGSSHYFGFYLCDAILKVNGKGGQPVYIKLAGQDSGRCTPK